MGKRSDGNFRRMKNDFYPTPKEAVLPLLPHLPKKFTYAEPCAGDGRLVDHLSELTEGEVLLKSDLEPLRSDIKEIDALSIDSLGVDYVITNPPWSRVILHPMIDKFSTISPTWLLFDADWMHTKQSIEYMNYCVKIVSIGRVKWIEDSLYNGKDNSAWYLFDKNFTGNTTFYGRTS